MYCLDIAFDIHDRLPESGLAALLALLRREPARTGVGVYGYGAAGQAIVNRLRAEPGVEVLAVFDRSTGLGDAQTPVHPPEALDQFPQMQLLIVTVPPRHVFAVGALVAKRCPTVKLVLLYNLSSIGADARSLYDELLDVMGGTPQPEALESRRTAILAGIAARMRRWRREADSDAGLPPREVAQRIADTGLDLGQYLFGQLERGVAALERPDGGDAILTRLAEEFPYFAPAREALASHYAQRNDFVAAQVAYAPTVRRYPLCYHVRTRLGELQLLRGDTARARADFEAAVRINPRDPLATAYLDDMNARRVPDPLPRWTGRLHRERPRETWAKPGFRCAVAVWGEAYLRAFMRFSVRSLLAADNLPYAAKATQLRFDLYTRPEDIPLLATFPEWSALREVADVEIISLEEARRSMGDASSGKYSVVTCCHNHALERSRTDGSLTCITMGDLVYSSNFLRYGLESLQAGHAAVMHPPTARFMQESFGSTLDQAGHDGLVLDLDAVSLFRLLQGLIHPDFRPYIDTAFVREMPGYLLWRCGGGGFLQHAFFTNPLFIARLPHALRMNDTIDVDLAYAVVDGGLQRFHVMRDLGLAAVYELTSERQVASVVNRPTLDAIYAKHWVQHNTDQMNRCIGTYSCIYNVGNGAHGATAMFPAAAEALTRLLA